MTSKSPANTASELVALIERTRLPLSTEIETQAALDPILRKAGAGRWLVWRECRISPESIIDFSIQAGTGHRPIGLEIKVNKAQPRPIWRQLLRYAETDAFSVLILATNRAMRMPAEIAGTPVLVASLGKAWL